MIVALSRVSPERWRLRAEGHARGGEAVCAAASTALDILRLGLLDDEGGGMEILAEESGLLDIAWKPSPSSDRLFTAVWRFLRLLAERNPDGVKLEVEDGS